MSDLIGAIDQGTQSTRFLVFDSQTLHVVASHQVSTTQIVPQQGWCDHDPMEIVDTVRTCLNAVAAKIGPDAVKRVKCIGITNQRETTVAWDSVTHKPLRHAIVWHDSRTQAHVAHLKSVPATVEKVRAKTGLPVSTYFSGLKMHWMLEHAAAVKHAAKHGTLRFGTIDSWLLYALTNGAYHVTDTSNASRTMLMDLHTCSWDQELLDLCGVPMNSLPKIVTSAFATDAMRIAWEDCPFFGVPITGMLGDQQAAAVGQGCFAPGTIKSTYGTGCFILGHCGDACPNISAVDKSLLVTVHYSLPNQTVTYALEGAVAIAGAAVSWLVDNIGLVSSPQESEAVASQVQDCGDVYFVPAFSGLFAPYWREDARAIWVGMTQYTRRPHLVRAVLESIALQCTRVVQLMDTDVHVLRGDGGVTHNALVMQMQADYAGIQVECRTMAEATALGIALMAGVGGHIYASMSEVQQVLHAAAEANEVRRFHPQMTVEERTEKLHRWEQAVERSFGWKQ